MTEVTTISSPSRTGRREEVHRGAVAMLPFLIGYAPFALVIGAAIASHATPAAGWAGIWLILGGSAHLATLQALQGPAALALLTGLLVNARLVVYSASLASAWRDQPGWFRAVGAALLIDPTWAAAKARADEPGTPAAQRHYYLAAGLTLSFGWCSMVTLGMVLGARWSGGLDLSVTAPLCVIALIGPRLLDSRTRVTVVAATVIAALTHNWPAGTGLLLVVAVAGLFGAFVLAESTDGGAA